MTVLTYLVLLMLGLGCSIFGWVLRDLVMVVIGVAVLFILAMVVTQ